MKQHFYQNIPHFFDYEDVYRRAIARAPHGAHLVELGVYEGASLAFLAVEAENAHKALRITGVDIFQRDDDHYSRVRKMLETNGIGWVSLAKGTTVKMSKLFDAKSLHFVFVDADHEEDAVFRDCQLYWPKLAYGGGWMAGHDLCADFPGVQKGVERFFGSSWTKMSKRCWRTLHA